MQRLSPILLLLAAQCAHSEIVWENPAQEFQRRPEDRELAVNFTFKNTGRQPVTITKVATSCGCTTADLPRKTYAPGEGGALTAKFTFGGRRGPQAKSVTVMTDDQKSAQLSFTCLILDEPVALAPSFVYWKVGDAADAKHVEVSVAPSPAIQIVAVASSNPRIAATLATVKAGEKYGVSIVPADTRQPESAEVFIQTNFPPEGPKAYTIHVRVK